MPLTAEPKPFDELPAVNRLTSPAPDLVLPFSASEKNSVTPTS